MNPKVEFVSKPVGHTVFCSCDSNYFREFGIAMISSCDYVGQPIHIHIINPNDSDVETLHKLSGDYKLTHSNERTEIPFENPKCYYAHNRFLIAPEILDECGSLLIVDIDSLFVKPVLVEESKTFGLFLREEGNQDTKTAAGIVLLRDSDCADRLSDTIAKSGFSHWYNDQVALHKEYVESGWANSKSFIRFDKRDMFWDSERNTKLFTGKGPRKYKPLYQKLKKKYESRVNSGTL